jgi:hypothetical protein
MRRLNHSLLTPEHRKRKEEIAAKEERRRKQAEDSKKLGELLKEQFARLLVFGVPLAALALWGNGQIEEFRAKERAFERRQQVWSSLYADFSSAFAEFRAARRDARLLYHEYVAYSKDSDQSGSRRYGAVIRDNNYYIDRAHEVQGQIDASFASLRDAIETGLHYGVVYKRTGYADYSSSFLDWLITNYEFYCGLLKSIRYEWLADASIYFEEIDSHPDSLSGYTSMSILMLDHNLMPTEAALKDLQELQTASTQMPAKYPIPTDR